MPWEVVSIEDVDEKPNSKWKVVSIDDAEPSTPTAPPNAAEQREYLHPLNASAELQKFGLSAAPPAQKPRVPILDTRKTSFGVGLGTSLAGTVRALGNLAPHQPTGEQMRDILQGRKTPAQVKEENLREVEKTAAAIGPSPDEEAEARKTLSGKIAYGAGYMAGELPKYALATRGAKGILSGIPGAAARPMVTTAAADVLGTAAVDISRDPNALNTEEGRRHFAANQLANILQSPLSRFGAMTRATGGAALGAGTEYILGGDASDITAGAILQGGMAGSPMGRADAPPLRISDALGPLARLGSMLNKRTGDPQYQANQQQVQQVFDAEAAKPEPRPITGDRAALEAELAELRLMPDKYSEVIDDDGNYVYLPPDRITQIKKQLALKPESTNTSVQTLSRTDVPSVKYMNNVREGTVDDAEAAKPETTPITGDRAALEAELAELRSMPDKYSEVIDDNGNFYFPIDRIAEIEEQLAAKTEVATPEITKPEITKPEITKPEELVTQQDSELAEADAMIRAAERGQVMSANPIDLAWAYFKKTEHAINQQGESVNAWLRANVFPERGETLRTAWLDAKSALSKLDRILRTPVGEGAHAIAQTNANLLHKVQLTVKDMIGAVTKKTATVDALPQAKRIKEIDAELDHYNRWKLEKEELESRRENLKKEKEGIEDGDARLAEINAEIKNIENELAKNKKVFEFSGSDRDEDGTPTKTVDDVIREREDLFNQLSPDQQKAVEEYGETLTKGYHALMDLMVESGLVSKEKGEEYKQDKSYLPLYREIEALRTSDTDSTPYFKGADGIRINPLLKHRNKGGSTLAIADPTKNFILYTAKALKAIQDNQLALYVADQRNRPEIQGLIRKVSPGIQHKLAKDEGTFWAKRDGKLEQYITTKELADAIRYSPDRQANLLLEILAHQGRVLRSTATGMNLAFGPLAFIRDIESAIFHQGVWNPLSYVRAAADVIGQTQNFKDFVMDGASMSGYFGSLRGIERLADQLERPNTVGSSILNTFNIRKVRSKADFVKVMADLAMAPLEGASKINEVFENIPRQAVYNRRRALGDDGRKAAYAARNATVDFQKMGRDMQVFNMVIPFVNARAQALENLRSTSFRMPVTAASRIVGAGLIPAMAAVLWNMTQYPDVYDEIPPEVKDKNLVLIFGREKDPITSEFTQAIAIPKTEALAPVMNFAERWLASVRSKKPIEIDKMATQFLSDTLPIPFAKGGEVSGLTVASSVIPPGIKAVMETSLNKNFYTGRDIDTRKMVDRGYKPQDRYIDGDTPLPAIYAGRFLGASPRKIENFVGTTTAGVGRQLMQLGDLSLRGLTGQSGVDRSANKLANMFTGSLLGVRGEDPFRTEREGIKEATEAVGVVKAEADHAAQKMIQSVLELPLQEQFPALQKAMQQYAQHPEVERIADELLSQFNVVFHRNAERLAHSLFSPVANLPEAERIPLLVQEMEKQKVPDLVREYVADLNRGGRIVTPMTKDYFKRHPAEVRAEYVVNVMKTIPTEAGRAAEWDRLVKLGVISPNVKAIFVKKWKEATQPAQGSLQP